MVTLQSSPASSQTAPWQNIQISVDLVEAARRLDNEFFRHAEVARIAEAARRYQKFLWLCQQFPEVPLAPTKDIDEMWHIHMLHPVAYYEDCMANFGAILAHDGGFGSASADEWQELERLFDQTAQLWRNVFGESYCNTEGTAAIWKCIRACRKGCKKA